VPTTGELFVGGQFYWSDAPKVFTIHFGGRVYEVWTPGLTQWTAPDGVIYHRGAVQPGGAYAIWAEWPSSAGPIPILPGEPGYIPPDVPPPYVPEAGA
jgi:hypothetical protein